MARERTRLRNSVVLCTLYEGLNNADSFMQKHHLDATRFESGNLFCFHEFLSRSDAFHFTRTYILEQTHGGKDVSDITELINYILFYTAASCRKAISAEIQKAKAKPHDSATSFKDRLSAYSAYEKSVIQTFYSEGFQILEKALDDAVHTVDEASGNKTDFVHEIDDADCDKEFVEMTSRKLNRLKYCGMFGRRCIHLLQAEDFDIGMKARIQKMLLSSSYDVLADVRVCHDIRDWRGNHMIDIAGFAVGYVLREILHPSKEKALRVDCAALSKPKEIRPLEEETIDRFEGMDDNGVPFAKLFW